MRTAPSAPLPGPSRVGRQKDGRVVGGPRTRGDSGYATAEAAMVLPALLVVLAMGVWVLTCVAAQLRCVDAARTSVRAAARGEAVVIAVAAGARIAPSGSVIHVRAQERQVTVDVSVAVRPFGRALRLLPAVQLAASATAEREDVAPEDPR